MVVENTTLVRVDNKVVYEVEMEVFVVVVVLTTVDVSVAAWTAMFHPSNEINPGNLMFADVYCSSKIRDL